ncbi:hypothetical protein GUJ93_ZPchr0007g5462 [Zizania palustris]|uniref:C2 domain-containing protein n=1 Tax=Zizania palustris TaxID=103762 RepID=A0A8J5TJ89_ZIZPA|nr:hypothetical protein GUJ93_ZPchr0007g5462 [Zizania palustris]
MAYRALELTLVSARDLKKVNLITRMEVFAVVSVCGNPLTRQCTLPDRFGGRHPTWNAVFQLAVPPTAAAASAMGAFLHVLLRTERARGVRDVGEVFVPLADLLAAGDVLVAPRPPRLASYPVHKVQSTEPRGVLTLSYRLGPVMAPPHLAEDTRPSVAAVPAYLVVPCYASPPYVYPPPPNPASWDDSAPAQRRKRGAVGGMLFGEMTSPDTAAYDAGYKAGVADGARRVRF